MAISFSKRSVNPLGEVKFFANVKDVRFGEPTEARKQAVCNINCVVSRTWAVRDADNGSAQTFDQVSQWFDVAAWGEQANRLRNLSPNDQIIIECSMADLKADPYVTKTGENAAGLKILRAEVTLHLKASQIEAMAQAEPDDSLEI